MARKHMAEEIVNKLRQEILGGIDVLDSEREGSDILSMAQKVRRDEGD